MLPHEPEAERLVLGALLIGEPDLIAQVLPLLIREDFYDPGHGHIWTAIESVSGAGMRCDQITVGQAMRRAGTLAFIEARGGEAYLSELAITAAYPTGTVDHAAVVKEAALQRRVIHLAEQAHRDAMGRTKSAADLLDGIQRQAAELAQRTIVQPVRRLKTYLRPTMAMLEQRTARKRAIVGIPTGLDDLDGLTGGFRPSDLVVIGARPSMGKTSFVVGSLIHAGQQGHPGLFFSLEMSAPAIVERCIALDGRIDGHRLQNGFLDGQHWARIAGSGSRLAPLPIDLDDSGTQTIATITAKSRQWRREKELFPTGTELGFIAIDYLQLLDPPGGQNKFINRDRELGLITKGLKALAKELAVPVVVLSQLNRSVESRGDKRPMCSDLRESGSIEQDADLICFIYRDEQYDKASKDKGIAEIIVAKQRNGPTGTARVAFVADETRFGNLSHRRDY